MIASSRAKGRSTLPANLTTSNMQELDLKVAVARNVAIADMSATSMVPRLPN